MGVGQTNAPTGSFSQISVGNEHACAIRPDGTISCWGTNAYGQVDAPAGLYAKVAAGYFHTCALRNNSSIACWGYNSDKQTAVPTGTFTQLSAGDWHTCAVKDDSTVVCWGRNTSGQLNVPPGRFSQVAAGGDHACALGLDGSIVCWGRNSQGEASPPPGAFAQITAGDYFSCALDVNGAPTCWGSLCVPFVRGCSSLNQPATCDGTGRWKPQKACGQQACVAGVCVGVCSPGAVSSCQNGSEVTCNAQGTWDTHACDQGCVDGFGCIQSCGGVQQECCASPHPACLPNYSCHGQCMGTYTCDLAGSCSCSGTTTYSCG